MISSRTNMPSLIRSTSIVRPTVVQISRKIQTSCMEANTDSKTVYQGRFGNYTIEAEDEHEVFLYRLGINFAAAGAIGLGLALKEIHIYVNPLKKALQVLWAAGLCGSLGLMLTQDTPAAFYVSEHPIAVWFVGPLFASLTGVAFKEGLCYGKWEASGLFGTIPLLLLGHLSGILSDDWERGFIASFSILMMVFALRKWTQPTKDDIGDKSVFEFLRLSPEEQSRRLS